MVYISNDGNVLESAPWSLKRLYNFFIGIIYMIIMFFMTMINPDMNKYGSDYARDYRPGFKNIPSKWPVHGLGPPRPPTRRLGRPNIGNTVHIPFGGCRSCAG